MSSWSSLRNHILPPSRNMLKKHMNTMERFMDLIVTQNSLETPKLVTSGQKTGYPSLDCGWGEKYHSQLNELNFEIIVHKFGDRYVSEELKQNHIWESYESLLVYQLIKNYKHDFIINIGANIGWYTLLCGKLVETEGKIVAVEPDPYNYMLLTDNIRLNGLNNTISTLNMGMGEKEYQGSLYLSQDNFGDHRTFYEGLDRNKISINISTLDQLSKHWKTYPDIIIMDTQGAEESIFAGAQESFSNGWNPLIFFEFCPSMSPHKGKKLIDILREWEKQKYIFHSIIASQQCVKKISVDEMAAYAEMTKDDDTEKGVRFLDLIAVPGGISLDSLLGTV